MQVVFLHYLAYYSFNSSAAIMINSKRLLRSAKRTHFTTAAMNKQPSINACRPDFQTYCFVDNVARFDQNSRVLSCTLYKVNIENTYM